MMWGVYAEGGGLSDAAPALLPIQSLDSDTLVFITHALSLINTALGFFPSPTICSACERQQVHGNVAMPGGEGSAAAGAYSNALDSAWCAVRLGGGLDAAAARLRRLRSCRVCAGRLPADRADDVSPADAPAHAAAGLGAAAAGIGAQSALLPLWFKPLVTLLIDLLRLGAAPAPPEARDAWRAKFMVSRDSAPVAPAARSRAAHAARASGQATAAAAAAAQAAARLRAEAEVRDARAAQLMITVGATLVSLVAAAPLPAPDTAPAQLACLVGRRARTALLVHTVLASRNCCAGQSLAVPVRSSSTALPKCARCAPRSSSRASTCTPRCPSFCRDSPQAFLWQLVALFTPVLLEAPWNGVSGGGAACGRDVAADPVVAAASADLIARSACCAVVVSAFRCILACANKSPPQHQGVATPIAPSAAAAEKAAGSKQPQSAVSSAAAALAVGPHDAAVDAASRLPAALTAFARSAMARAVAACIASVDRLATPDADQDTHAGAGALDPTLGVGWDMTLADFVCDACGPGTELHLTGGAATAVGLDDMGNFVPLIFVATAPLLSQRFAGVADDTSDAALLTNDAVNLDGGSVNKSSSEIGPTVANSISFRDGGSRRSYGPSGRWALTPNVKEQRELLERLAAASEKVLSASASRDPSEDTALGIRAGAALSGGHEVSSLCVQPPPVSKSFACHD